MFYIHNVPGRVRIISETVKKNSRAADAVRMALSALTGIGVVHINLVTGGILIHYNPKAVTVRDIVSVIENKGYFDREKAISNDDYFRNGMAKAGSLVVKTAAGTLAGKALGSAPWSFLLFLV